MSAHVLTPVYGGHVHAGTWEHFATRRDVNCVACGISVKSDGRAITERGEGPDTEPNLCPGWQARPIPTTRVLPDVVRGMTREAPDDKPNGPSEEAIEALSEAHLEALESRSDGVVDGILERRESDALGHLMHALADDARALRLALEHDERSAR